MSASAVQATRERRADSLAAGVPLSLKPTRARCHAGSGAQLREMCRIDRAGAAASRVFARRPGIHRTERPKAFTPSSGNLRRALAVQDIGGATAATQLRA